MSSRHTLKFNDWEATDETTQRVNTDYALTEGRIADNRDPEDYDPEDYGEDDDDQHRVRRQPHWYYDATEPLKRGNAQEISRLDVDTWHIGNVREGRDWTCRENPLTRVNRRLQREASWITGIPAGVPEAEWSMSPWRCAVCWDQLDKPPLGDKVKFCGPACKRAADAARKARKRRLAGGVRKYPLSDKGWYVNQFTPWPRSGLNVTPPGPEMRPQVGKAGLSRIDNLEVRHGIMIGVRRRPMTPPSWWVDTVSAILTTKQGRMAA